MTKKKKKKKKKENEIKQKNMGDKKKTEIFLEIF